jgi:hypothetical protein
MNELKNRRKRNPKIVIKNSENKNIEPKIENNKISNQKINNNNSNNMIFSFSPESFQSISSLKLEKSIDSNDMLLFSLTSEQFRKLKKNQKKDSNGNLIFEDEE